MGELMIIFDDESGTMGIFSNCASVFTKSDECKSDNGIFMVFASMALAPKNPASWMALFVLEIVMKLDSFNTIVILC